MNIIKYETSIKSKINYFEKVFMRYDLVYLTNFYLFKRILFLKTYSTYLLYLLKHANYSTSYFYVESRRKFQKRKNYVG